MVTHSPAGRRKHPSPARTTSPALSRSLASGPPSNPAPAPKHMIKRMPQASVRGSYMFKRNRNDPYYVVPEFIMILKHFQPDMRDSMGRLDERKLVPSWLPVPPHPATHERRYLRAPFYPPTAPAGRKNRLAFQNAEAAWTGPYDASPGDSGKWESAAAPIVSAEIRPVLRVLVSSSVRRVHKLAVIRNRVRTRLTEAMRIAVAHMEQRGTDIDKMLNPRRNLLLVFAGAAAHSKPMDELAQEMRDGLRFLAAVADGSIDAKAQRKHINISAERNRAAQLAL
ncbi:uncharacterized protein PSANT_03314 [Moesziomyces antarcticus]|uniref:Uncharacterized protein n=1 Tax=Pseudozyma antarctica TaxID=84753 RepID=A0A5C3FMM0_PSEA2|nr:uncharacterized protein PSANT_03314 [Moesziomyces antarcticus]